MVIEDILKFKNDYSKDVQEPNTIYMSKNVYKQLVSEVKHELKEIWGMKIEII